MQTSLVPRKSSIYNIERNGQTATARFTGETRGERFVFSAHGQAIHATAAEIAKAGGDDIAAYFGKPAELRFFPRIPAELQ